MFRLVRQARRAIQHLSPEKVRRATERPISVGLLASSASGYQDLEEFLLPSSHAADRRTDLTRLLRRVGGAEAERYDLILCEEGCDSPPGSFLFRRDQPERTITEILAGRPELDLALARNFVWFRSTAVDAVVKKVARENALFAMATALPNVLPTFLPLPWTLGEFASDTAFITMNQIRMAFSIAAAFNRPLGYAVQKAEIGAIVAGAFGWRALARGLVGKIPLGRGIVPKGAVAYAGTYVIGKGLQRYHEAGSAYRAEEHASEYAAALREGESLAREFAESRPARPRVLQ